jgi:two-component system, OmpR family, phosphate regulon sensor histidine kinase PhoR
VKIARRFFLSFLILAGGLFLSLLAVSISVLKTSATSVAEADLKDFATFVANALPDPVHSTPESIENFAVQTAKGSRIRLTVILPDGRVVADTEAPVDTLNNHLSRPEVASALRGEVGFSSRYGYSTAKDYLYVAVPIYREGRIAGAARAAMPFTAVGGGWSALEPPYLWWMALILAAVVAGAAVLARGLSLPFEGLKAAADRLTSGDFETVLKPNGPVEIRVLGEALNGVIREIRSRIEAADAHRAELDAMLQAMTEAVVLLDKNLRIRIVNPAATSLVRNGPRTAETRDIVGHSVLEAFRSSALAEIAERAFSSTTPIEETVPLYGQDETRFLQVGAVSVGSDPEKRGVLLALTDITRLTRLERIRKDFVANVSHELKTPITSIKGFVETLFGGALEDPENARHFLQIIEKHTLRMEAIIEDLLYLAKLEEKENAQTLERFPVEIRALLERAVSFCASEAEKKKIAITIDCPADLVVPANPGLLEQAVANLIDNAIKYSADEHPVSVRALEEAGGLLIEVEDSGAGIPARDLPRVFERFYRVDKSRDRARGGTGLGLAIVRHIALLHSGDVSARSVEGSGSTFSIHIPTPGSD